MKKIPEVYFKESIQNSLGIEIISFATLRDIFAHPLNHNPFQAHQLKFNVLLLVTEGGEGLHSIDFKEYTFSRQSVILISKDQINRFIDLPKNNEGYLLMFTEDLFLDIGMSFPFLISHFYNNQLYDPIHTLNETHFKDLHDLILKIDQKTRSEKKSVRSEIVYSYVKILLLEIFACREMRNNKTVKTAVTEDFIRFQLLLKRNYAEHKQVQFYAEQLNTSTKKLNAITKATVNRTAKEVIVSHLILEAKKLLITPDVSSKEVAYRLGFEEPTNFSKFFRTHTNMLPSEFTKAYY